jgi:hypothetical protein
MGFPGVLVGLGILAFAAALLEEIGVQNKKLVLSAILISCGGFLHFVCDVREPHPQQDEGYFTNWGNVIAALLCLIALVSSALWFYTLGALK